MATGRRVMRQECTSRRWEGSHPEHMPIMWCRNTWGKVRLGSARACSTHYIHACHLDIVRSCVQLHDAVSSLASRRTGKDVDVQSEQRGWIKAEGLHCPVAEWRPGVKTSSRAANSQRVFM